MQKLTTKQLTEVVNTQQNQIQSLLGIINAYIEFEDNQQGFTKFLKERKERLDKEKEN